MRVISGRYRGRQLAKVRGQIRPTSDRLRETLFNIVGEAVVGSKWLDAFAGSGAVGIEALSREARHVIFNDISRDALRLMEKNLQTAGIEEGFEIRGLDVFSLFRRVDMSDVDFVFLDPPYDFGRYEKLLEKMCSLCKLQPRVQVIVEVFKKTVIEPPDCLRLVREVESGDSRLLFLKPALDQDDQDDKDSRDSKDKNDKGQ